MARERINTRKESKSARLKIPRQPMPEQEPLTRITNFDEVALGYTADLAVAEAQRCISCRKPRCIEGCPVLIDIPVFIELVAQRDFIGAARKIKEMNSLPAICGRVCPQENQCEEVCTLSIKGESVAIGNLERFVADYERMQGQVELPEMKPPTGKRVAIVGSGPAGLSAASDLALYGHSVRIFEALQKPGGVLRYGIPEFRMPKSILDEEIDYLKKLGVEIETNAPVGRLYTIDELLEEGYDALFIGTGAGAPYFMGIPGENLLGIYSSNEFLTRINLMKAYQFPNYDTPINLGKRVAVIGGGNTAMDAARISKRMGPEKVMLVYRRSEEEMPARLAEVHHAREEEIEFHTLTNPVEFIGDEEGYVVAMRCIRMELGEPDDSGRRRPIPIEGSEFEKPVDTVIIAIGSATNKIIADTTPDLDVDERGHIIADEETGQTSKKGVFAGGDVVTGAATVILAMGAGKQAATAIDKYLMESESSTL